MLEAEVSGLGRPPAPRLMPAGFLGIDLASVMNECLQATTLCVQAVRVAQGLEKRKRRVVCSRVGRTGAEAEEEEKVVVVMEWPKKKSLVPFVCSMLALIGVRALLQVWSRGEDGDGMKIEASGFKIESYPGTNTLTPLLSVPLLYPGSPYA